MREIIEELDELWRLRGPDEGPNLGLAVFDLKARRHWPAIRAAVEALEEIRAGVDHPEGIDAQPAFYEAVTWAQGIALAALGEEPR